jgi:hypothetical protein
VQVLNAPTWDGRAPRAGTYFILIARGHANTLGVPTRYGNFVPGDAVPYASAEAVLSHMRQHVNVEHYNSVTVQELKEKVPKTLPKKALSACQCGCGELLQLGPMQRAGGAVHALHGYVAKTVVYGGLKREGLQHDGTAAGSGLSGDLESSESATLGEAVARKSAPQRAPMSYKAALCKGLGAANSSGTSRVVAQPAATRVKSQATAGKGTRVASGYHEAALRGGRGPAERPKAMQRGNQTTTRNSSYGANTVFCKCPRT